MTFYENQIFHIYNQGNNHRQLFYSEENYQFFIWKMRAYLLPYGQFIAWCLMPNHFHWQFFVKRNHITRKELRVHIDKVEYQRRIKKYGKKAQPVKRIHTRKAKDDALITVNKAIGDLLAGYTRAINKEKGWTGSLFREECKAKDGWIDEFVTLTKNGKDDFRFLRDNNYAYRCFCYIHENPVKSGMVKISTDYPYSSARDYAGLRKGSLCNLEMGRNLVKYVN